MTNSPSPSPPHPPYPPLHGTYPPPRRRRAWPWVVAFGEGLLLALCVVGVLALPRDSSTSATSPPASSTVSHATAGLNVPVRDGKFEFTVTQVVTGVRHVGLADYGETAQGRFVLVHVTVRNVGTKAQTFDGSDQRVYDDAGRIYSDDTAAELDANARNETFLEDVNPGNHVAGVVVFDVPPTVHLTRLELHDSPFSGGVTVRIG